VAFLGARASNPVQWTVSQDVRSEGHRVVTLHCRRKEANFGKRSVAVQSVRSINVLLTKGNSESRAYYYQRHYHQKAAGYLNDPSLISKLKAKKLQTKKFFPHLLTILFSL